MELRRKKVKTRHIRYSFKKVKVPCSAFYEQKVKNIAIEYWLQSIFPNPAYLARAKRHNAHDTTDKEMELNY